MSSEPDAPRPDDPGAGRDANESAEPSGRWSRARQSLRVPGGLVRLVRRDPHHVPERLTIYTIDRQADEARSWAQRVREGTPQRSPAVLVDDQLRRIWALTWIVPVTFMIVMSWACEGDARRFGQRIRTHYGDADSATPKEDRAASNRAFTVARGALVALSLAIPLGLIGATVLNGTGPLGFNVPEVAGALIALGLVLGVGVAAVRG